MLNKIIKEDIEFIIGYNLPWDNFNNSTVLIAGVGGFLSTYILETLLYLNDKYNKKINVIALALDEKRTLEKFSHHKNRVDLKFIFQNVCEPIAIGNNQKINYIIHAASNAAPQYYRTDPIGTISANTIGTMNLLKITEKEHCKGFLYLSTGGVYGKVEEKNIPINEDGYGYIDPTDVEACYNESKRMGENICVGWFHQYGIPTKIARISYAYGPGMDLDKDKRVFPSFVSDVVADRNIQIASDGSATRSFCYVADVVSAFFTILLTGKNGEAYNIGAEKETTISELANLFVKLYPEKNIKIIRKQTDKSVNDKNVIKRSFFDISKIKSLGWKPAFDLEKGCKRTILSYRNW